MTTKAGERLLNEPGSRRFRDLLARERQDMAWLVHVVAAMYDEISGGRISKPMTYPSEVVAVYEERMTEAAEEAAAEARATVLADLEAAVNELPLFDPGMDGCEPWQDNWDRAPDEDVHVTRAAVLDLIEKARA